MQCPRLNDLPNPPSGKTGWPWTEDSSVNTHDIDESMPWQKISIITPSYSQGKYIEETIRSVLLQGYPNIEYIIIDGGSTDESIEIIKKYEPWLRYWISEHDHGQSDAINKGFHLATGEILAWLNSDDTYLSGAMFSVASQFLASRDHQVVFGNCQYIDEQSKSIKIQEGNFRHQNDLLDYYKFWEGETYVPQPATFFGRKIFNQVGELNETLHYAMDVDLWLRMSEVVTFSYIPKTLATWRLHSISKTVSQNTDCQREYRNVCSNYLLSRRDMRYYQFWISYLIYPFKKVAKSQRLKSSNHFILAWDQLNKNSLSAIEEVFKGVLSHPPSAFNRSLWILLFQILFGKTVYHKIKNVVRRMI